MVMRLTECDAPMSTVTVRPFTIGVAVLQRVAVPPSTMRAGTSPPPVAEAVAVQPLRGSTGCPLPPAGTVVAPVRRMSRGEEPTETVLVPAALVQPLFPVLRTAGVQGGGDVARLRGVEGDALE